MPNYAELDLNGLLPGEPWTADKALAVYLNLEAALAGAANAPRLFYGAFSRLNAGTVVKIRYDGETAAITTASAPTILRGFGIAQAGSVNVQYDYRRAGTEILEVTIRLIRVRGGSVTEIASHETLSNTYVTNDEDVDVQPGDLVAIDTTSAPDRYGQVRNVRLRTDANSFPMPVNNFGYHENIGTIT